MRVVSEASLRRQIARVGPRWGCYAIKDDEGVLRVATSQPRTIPGPGVGLLLHEDIEIASISMSYPFTTLLRHRVARQERSLTDRTRARRAAMAAEEKRLIEPWEHDFKRELGRALRGRVQVGASSGR